MLDLRTLRLSLLGLAFAVALPAWAEAQGSSAQGGIRVRLPGDVVVSRCMMTVSAEDGTRLQSGSLSDTVTLPAGRYRLIDLQFNVRTGREEWSYSFRTEDYEPTRDAVPVQAGTATLLKPKVVIGVKGSSGGEDYSLSLVTAGPLGMKLSDATINEERPPAPRFSLVNAHGKVLDQGEFEYG